MPAPGHITVELRAGPALASAIRLAGLVEEFEGLIPDWHAAERQRLHDELATLVRDLRRRDAYAGR